MQKGSLLGHNVSGGWCSPQPDLMQSQVEKAMDLSGFDRLPGAVLLDLDDTIVAYGDPEESWLTVCREFAPRVGVGVERLLEAIREAREWYWGDPERHRQGRLSLLDTRRKIAASAFCSLGIDNPGLAHGLGEAYARTREDGAQLFPDAVDTLEYLRSCGVRLALVTNGASDLQRGKIERFDLEAYFDHIQVEGEFGLGKPDERVFRHVLAQLGARAAEAWMVGDDLERDVAGAQRAGLFAVWVDWRGSGLRGQAWSSLTGPSEACLSSGR